MLPRRNVLIFHLGALGDFVLTWPLALALGRLYPQSRVFYVTHAGKGQLAEKALRVDSADIEGGWHSLFSDDAVLPPPAERLLASAHTVLSFLTDGQDAWARNVKRLAPEATLAPVRSQATRGRHAAESIAEQLGPWPAMETAVRQMLRSIADRGIGGRGAADGGVLIHPGSGSPDKCWPLERFIELGRRFLASGRQVRFVIGETESERWPVAKIDQLREVALVETPSDLVGLWKLLNGATLFVGNDSGPSHLAGILGVPTVALFGTTTPSVWKPLGPKVSVLARDPLESLTVDEVRGIAGRVGIS